MSKLLLALVFSALLFATQFAQASATVQCAGTDDTAAVQAALNGGGVVRLKGDWCTFTAPLVVAVNDTGILSEAHIYSWANPAFRLQANSVSIMGDGRRVKVWSQGVGITVLSGGGVTIRDLTLNTPNGHGIWIMSGAGLFVSYVNFNGQQWMNTHPIRVEGPWDTIKVHDILSEEHDHGIRFGGGVFNAQLDNVHFDRLRGSYGNGLWIDAPANTGNIQVANMWMSAGNCAIALSTSTGATISVIQLVNVYATGFQQQQPCTSGNIQYFQGSVNYLSLP